MRVPALLFLLVLAGGALAQPAQRYERFDRGQQMSREERQRMREDMREAYRDRDRGFERHRALSPAERDKLRQDIQDANREMRRRRRR